jgi:type IV pilus assembly protein PilB
VSQNPVTAASFFDQLVRRGLITEEASRALRENYHEDVVAALLHVLRENPHLRDELGKLWGDALGVAYVDPTRTFIQYDLAVRLPVKFAMEKLVLPLYELEGAITVVTPTPHDKELISQAESHFNTFVSPLFAFPDQIQAVLEIAFNTESSLTDMIRRFQEHAGSQPAAAVQIQDLKALGEDRCIIEFCRGLMLYSLKSRASDLHIEPREDGVRVRCRIDGILHDVLFLDRSLHAPVVTRYKLLAEADIGESRRPQDGTVRLALAHRTMDFRFSSMPTVYGEKVVLRVLGQAQFTSVPDLVELDFSADILQSVKKVALSPNGIFCLTGPTGSGKTTTLYAVLKHINQAGVNIVTIENPVEYRLPGINQTQINEVAGITFPTALRALLRQDPDVILVGEIRDLETASIACQAALTGHLVLTTLHANDALQAITRLTDLGIDRQLLGAAALGFMAQRLARRLCEHCREPYTLTEEETERIFEWDGDTPVRFWRAQGCDKCNRLGYAGRVAIHEVFLPGSEAKSLIARGAPDRELKELANRDGFFPMVHDGLKKVLRGITTYEEISRILPEG